MQSDEIAKLKGTNINSTVRSKCVGANPKHQRTRTLLPMRAMRMHLRMNESAVI